MPPSHYQPATAEEAAKESFTASRVLSDDRWHTRATYTHNTTEARIEWTQCIWHIMRGLQHDTHTIQLLSCNAMPRLAVSCRHDIM